MTAVHPAPSTQHSKPTLAHAPASLHTPVPTALLLSPNELPSPQRPPPPPLPSPASSAPRSLSTALWIWPMDPLATGACSMLVNSSDSGTPNAASMAALVWRNAWAGACRLRGRERMGKAGGVGQGGRREAAGAGTWRLGGLWCGVAGEIGGPVVVRCSLKAEVQWAQVCNSTLPARPTLNPTDLTEPD